MTTIEKIKAEIERRIREYDKSIEKYSNKQKSIKAERDAWKWAECKSLLSFLDTLQVDEPEGLDEAAKEYSNNLDYYHYTGDDPAIAFKAGAEWMAEQGETIEGSLCYGPHLRKVIVFLEDCPKMWKGSSQEVIVQIRKKSNYEED